MFSTGIKNDIYKKVVKFMTGTDRKPVGPTHLIAIRKSDMKYRLDCINGSIKRLREEMEYAESIRNKEIQEIVSTTECSCVHPEGAIVLGSSGRGVFAHQWNCEKMIMYRNASDNGAHTFKVSMSKSEFEELEYMLIFIEELHALSTNGYENL